MGHIVLNFKKQGKDSLYKHDPTFKNNKWNLSVNVV